MPGWWPRLTDVGDADAIAAHRARDADAFARWEPSRPAPMHVGAMLALGTRPDMPVTLPAAGSLADRITRVAAITRQRKTPARATSVALLGAAVPAADLHRAAALVRQPPVAGPRLRHQPARAGAAAHLRRCPAASGDSLSRTPPAMSPSPSPRCPTPGHFGLLCCPARSRYRMWNADRRHAPGTVQHVRADRRHRQRATTRAEHPRLHRYPAT